MKIAIPGVLILVGMIGLITMGVLQGAIPEIGVTQLSSGEFGGQTVRLLGVIDEIETDVRPMRFTIRDMADKEMTVVATVDDHRPDIFKVDTDVAVIGVYDVKTQAFEGTKIFTKCPSKYEATDTMGEGSEAARSGYGNDSSGYGNDSYGEGYGDEGSTDPVQAADSTLATPVVDPE